MKWRTINPGFGGSLARFTQTADPAILWLGRWSVAVAWVGLLVAALMPPHGLGFSLCWFESAAGVPCPGCGMTRSLSCALRGMFAESWFYHPLGLPVLVLFIFIAAQSLFPADVRERLSALIRRRAMVFNVAYMLFVTSFMSFGVARALLNLRQLELLAILHSPV